MDTQNVRFRLSDEELDLVKRTFAGNERLRDTCYKLFLQAPLTFEEEEAKDEFLKGEVEDVFRKGFTPGLENEQIFFGIDDWLDVQIFDKAPEEAIYFILAREHSINYVNQQLDVIFGEGVEKIKFEGYLDFEGKEPHVVYVDLLTRKEIVAKTLNMINAMYGWAGDKNETPEEMKKRLFKDSSK